MQSWRNLACILLVLVALPEKGFAQFQNTLYWMQGVPQASFLNPARQPSMNAYFGMPALTSVYAGASLSGWSPRQLVEKDPFDELIWNTQDFAESLESNMLIEAGFHQQWLGAGIRFRKSFLAFSIRDRLDFSWFSPPAFQALVLQGNEFFSDRQGLDDFSGISADLSYYREYALDFSLLIGDVAGIGFRVKRLYGFSNFNLNDPNLHLLYNEDALRPSLGADAIIRTSHPATIGPLEQFSLDMDASTSVYDYIRHAENPGWAMDLGMELKPFRNLSLSVSLQNLGYIDWSEGVENYVVTGSGLFEGIDIQAFYEGNRQGLFEEFVRKIAGAYELTGQSESYRTYLNPRLYSGLGLGLGPRHQLGLLSRLVYRNADLYHALTFSYNIKPSPAIGLSLSYTVSDHSYAQAGAGIHLNAGPLQFYLASDNVLGAFVPLHAQVANIYFGLNWVFGYRPQSDKPLFNW